MATARRDFYEVLGVPRDADAKAIKDAFRTLALRYHPDRNKEPGAEERFKEVAEAYAVLSDPQKRSEYDARGFAGVTGVSPEDLFSGIDFGDILGQGFDFGRNFGGGGLFDRLFGRGRHGPPRGEDLSVALVVPLERVLSGGEEVVRFTRPRSCSSCKGTGAEAGTSPRSCQTCQGTGRHVVEGKREGNVFVQRITTCPECRGRGNVIDKPCPECRGQGTVEREETLTVKVPPGFEEDMALRFPGLGHPCQEPGGSPGDLFVVLHSAPDPRFERRGSHLVREETVEVAEAALGTRREVPTLDGPVSLTIPPGTQPGTVLRLQGKGLPVPGGRRGALFVTVQVHVPETLTGEERKLYEHLRALAGSGPGRKDGRTKESRPHAHAG